MHPVTQEISQQQRQQETSGALPKISVEVWVGSQPLNGSHAFRPQLKCAVIKRELNVYGQGWLIDREDFTVPEDTEVPAGNYKFNISGFSEPSIKRPRRDTSADYLGKLLAPELTKLPKLEELPGLVAKQLSLKLPVMSHNYNSACKCFAGAAELLAPFPDEESGAAELAFRVTAVLKGNLRNVAGENTLHHDVDDLFEQMFDLAADAGLLVYHSERDTGDTLSGTSGRCLRPDFLLWVGSALLFAGEEKATARELPAAEDELLSKLGGAWSTKANGECPYMLGYAVGGSQLKIVAISSGHLHQLLHVDMATLSGKLHALVAVVNLLRLLRVMAKQPMPSTTWGLMQSINIKDDENRVISTVTNMGDYAHKQLRNFEDRYKQYAPPGCSPLEFLESVYQAIAGANHLVQAMEPPKLRQDGTYIVKLHPVGLAYHGAGPRSGEEARLAIRGVLLGCGELHSQGFVHRDLRWPNVIKVVEGGMHTVKLIDMELAGKAGVLCNAAPYPLRHWLYDDGRSVLEHDGAYTARSDLKMVGKELMGKLAVDLGHHGRDLKRKLENGEYEDADSALAHAWFNTA